MDTGRQLVLRLCIASRGKKNRLWVTSDPITQPRKWTEWAFLSCKWPPSKSEARVIFWQVCRSPKL